MNINSLLVVSVVESAVGNTEISLKIVSVRVFLVAFKDCQSSNEVTLLQEMGNLRQFVLLL